MMNTSTKSVKGGVSDVRNMTIGKPTASEKSGVVEMTQSGNVPSNGIKKSAFKNKNNKSKQTKHQKKVHLVVQMTTQKPPKRHGKWWKGNKEVNLMEDYEFKTISDDFDKVILVHPSIEFNTAIGSYDVPSFYTNRGVCMLSGLAYLLGYSFSDIKINLAPVKNKRNPKIKDFAKEIFTLLHMEPQDAQCQAILNNDFLIERDDRPAIALLRSLCRVQGIEVVPLHDNELMESWWGKDKLNLKSQSSYLFLTDLLENGKFKTAHVFVSQYKKERVLPVTNVVEDLPVLVEKSTVEVVDQPKTDADLKVGDIIIKKEEFPPLGQVSTEVKEQKVVEIELTKILSSKTNSTADTSKLDIAVKSSKDQKVVAGAEAKLYSSRYENLGKSILSKSSNKGNAPQYMCDLPSWQEAYNYLMQFKPLFPNHEVVVHYNRQLRGSAMAFYYNEADVRIHREGDWEKALINFGAHAEKGKHVSKVSRAEVISMYALDGPMDFVNDNTPVLVSLGVNLCLALTTKQYRLQRSPANMFLPDLEQYKWVVSQKVETKHGIVIYSARSDYLGLFGQSVDGRVFKDTQAKIACVTSYRRDRELFCELDRQRNFYRAFDPYKEIQNQALCAMTLATIQNSQSEDYCAPVKVVTQRKTCFEALLKRYRVAKESMAERMRLFSSQREGTYTLVGPQTSELYDKQVDMSTSSFGSNQIQSSSIHHCDQKWYNEAYNVKVLPRFTVYGPSGDIIRKGFYEAWKDHCLCHTNRHKQTMFELSGTEQLQYYQFATCPLNSLSSVLGRQAASRLFPSGQMLRQFKKFFDRHWLRNLASYFQKVSMDEYLQHVAETDQPKSRKYRTAYEKFVNGVFTKPDAELFVKVGE